jgi:coenzyme F420-reducing hydrogenase alpha subunit
MPLTSEEENKIKTRLVETYSLAKRHIDKTNEKLKRKGEREIDAGVDVRLLRLAVKGAYDDIERYKDYHLRNKRHPSASPLSNAIKRSAYMCKWICKFKPLREKKIPDAPKLDAAGAAMSSVNEIFALDLSRGYIGGELKKYRYREEYIQEFIYDLSYRHLGEDALLHIFSNIFQDVKERNDTGILYFPKQKT